MSITSAIVLFAVIWFLTFLVVIPFRVQTQGDLGDVLEGTQAGSPEHHHLKTKAWITTGISAVLWVVIFSVIVTDFITLEDIDLFQYLAQPDFD
ncbi:MAG: DUF1467 family protein [Pseudoprimorskyibacter sp.]|nr:DUF1467 family protein [Pseudoprimorskyibacter sp.]